MTRLKSKIIFLFVILISSSCSRNSSVIIDDTSCEAPCWRGVIPGISTIQEVKPLPNSMSDVLVDTIMEIEGSKNPFLEKGVVWRFTGVDESLGEVYFQDEKVTRINFSIEKPLILSDLITKFGEPTLILIQSTEGDPSIYLTIDIIYIEKGICLSSQPSFFATFENPETYRIKPSTKIGNVSYIDPSLPNGQIISGCLAGLNEKTYQEIQQQWAGYAPYKVSTWP